MHLQFHGSRVCFHGVTVGIDFLRNNLIVYRGWGYGLFSLPAQDGQIDADELQRCLTSSGIGGSYKPFSRETCTIMINMLDRDYSGQMGFSEFKELWTALNQWKVCGHWVGMARQMGADGVLRVQGPVDPRGEKFRCCSLSILGPVYRVNNELPKVGCGEKFRTG